MEEETNISSLTESVASRYGNLITDLYDRGENFSLNLSIEENENVNNDNNQHENNLSEQDKITTLNQRVKEIFCLIPREFCTNKNYSNAVSILEHPRTVRLSCLLSEKYFVIIIFVFISTPCIKKSSCDARSVFTVSTQFMAKILS